MSFTQKVLAKFQVAVSQNDMAMLVMRQETEQTVRVFWSGGMLSDGTDDFESHHLDAAMKVFRHEVAVSLESYYESL